MQAPSQYVVHASILAGATLAACASNVTTAVAGASGTGGAGHSTSVGSTTGPGSGAGSTTTGPGTGAGATTGPGSGGGPTDGGGPPDAITPIDAGPPDGSPPPDGATTCPGSDTCTTCLSASCSSAYCSCYGNVDCGHILQCFAACAPNDMACYQTCETANPEGISAAFLLAGCAATQCPQACPGNMTITACQQCVYTKCDVQVNACFANVECVAYLACLKPCNGGPTCVAQCQAAHPTGLVDASKVNTCATVNCPGICN